MKSKELIETIKKKEGNRPFDANKLYKEVEDKLSELAYYKALNRFAKEDVLMRVGKGVYCLSEGKVPTPEEIMAPYIEKKKGMKVGYALYDELGLTKGEKGGKELFTNALRGNKKTVQGVKIKKVDLVFDEKTKEHVAILEVLADFSSIEDLDLPAFVRYAEGFAKDYDEATMKKVLRSISYKKSTIAFLRDVLDHYGVENSLMSYLSPLSIYKFPRMEELCKEAS